MKRSFSTHPRRTPLAFQLSEIIHLPHLTPLQSRCLQEEQGKECYDAAREVEPTQVTTGWLFFLLDTKVELKCRNTQLRVKSVSDFLKDENDQMTRLFTLRRNENECFPNGKLEKDDSTAEMSKKEIRNKTTLWFAS
ncbi:uncharacterized protein V6R79_007120 [Siganus canaliculatus]